MESGITPGLHFRGWILMSFVSIVLFIIVGVPAAYIPTTRNRTIYAAVVTPVMWLLYNLIGYFVLYRPMLHCTAVFRTGVCCSTKYTEGNTDVNLITKEMYQLNNSLHALRCETAEMKGAITYINQQLDSELKSQRDDDGIHRCNSPFTTRSQGAG